jgi:signal transduction histidine kinase
VLGAVTFYFDRVGDFDAESRQLLRAVADQMAATAEKARLIEDLRRANAHLEESNTELEQQYAALLEARRVKDEFLANISHELRTPLTAVIGYISIMQEGLAGPVTDEQQSTLRQVKGSSEQLLGLIDDLLELTTLKRSALAVESSEFDPRTPLHDAVEATPGRAEAVVLTVVAPDAPPVMRSDRKKVVKLLVTLLRNAYKFTPSGEVRVVLEIVPGANGEPDRAVYRIEDTGIGIPADAQELVFEEFRQVDGSLTRRHGGSGLGLALARRLARLLGGEITVTSSPGAGSTFRVDLPLRWTASLAIEEDGGHGIGRTAGTADAGRDG